MDRNYMTVKELKEALEEFDDDLPVLMNGIDSGFDGFCYPFESTVSQFPLNTYHDGEFQYTGDDDEIKVVILYRTNRDD